MALGGAATREGPSEVLMPQLLPIPSTTRADGSAQPPLPQQEATVCAPHQQGGRTAHH